MEDLSYFLPPQKCDKAYSVSEINRGVSELLSYHGSLLWVEGEVSSFKRASSGHCYFRLKDKNAQIPAVLWSSNANKLLTPLQYGEKIAIIASLRVYEQGGYYQLNVQKVIPQGIGLMAKQMDLLKEKLLAEGFFAEERKKTLPQNIKKVGVVTAKTGAALHDIISVLQKSAPHLDIVLSSALVQGSGAPASLEKSLSALSNRGDIDLIIFGRGGGSAEDLFCFNDERVVRAVANCDTPLISAVGHEVDTTLSDFAADIRAATPSVAAEIAAQHAKTGEEQFHDLCQLFVQSSKKRIGNKFRSFHSKLSPYLFQRVLHRIGDNRCALDAQTERFEREFAHKLQQKNRELAHMAEQLHLLSPLSLLKRGYAVVQKEDRQVFGTGELASGDDITLIFDDGKVKATVTDNNRDSA